jgi:hypothetical protein
MNEEKANFTIAKNNALRNFREQHDREEYIIYLNFLKNYSSFFPQDEIRKINDFICCFTLDIPIEPVFSPHDTKKLHVFEKAEIEKHLDSVNAEVARAQASHSSQSYINDLKNKACPFRGTPFSKEDLVYDHKYSLNVIHFLRAVLLNIKDEVHPSFDPVVKRGLECLLNHYKSIFFSATEAAVHKLGNDCIKLGGDYAKVESVCSQFREGFEELAK